MKRRLKDAIKCKNTPKSVASFQSKNCTLNEVSSKEIEPSNEVSSKEIEPQTKHTEFNKTNKFNKTNIAENFGEAKLHSISQNEVVNNSAYRQNSADFQSAQPLFNSAQSTNVDEPTSIDDIVKNRKRPKRVKDTQNNKQNEMDRLNSIWNEVCKENYEGYELKKWSIKEKKVMQSLLDRLDFSEAKYTFEDLMRHGLKHWNSCTYQFLPILLNHQRQYPDTPNVFFFVSHYDCFKDHFVYQMKDWNRFGAGRWCLQQVIEANDRKDKTIEFLKYRVNELQSQQTENQKLKNEIQSLKNLLFAKEKENYNLAKEVLEALKAAFDRYTRDLILGLRRTYDEALLARELEDLPPWTDDTEEFVRQQLLEERRQHWIEIENKYNHILKNKWRYDDECRNSN